MSESKADQCGDETAAVGPIVLYAEPSAVAGGVQWRLDFENPPMKANVLVDLPHKAPGRDIIFNLVGGCGFVRFDTDDPIWVHKGQKCPPPDCSKDQQISVKDCSPTKLTIHDKNDGPPCVLTYQLNFIGAEPLDPEIKNGGNNLM